MKSMNYDVIQRRKDHRKPLELRSPADHGPAQIKGPVKVPGPASASWMLESLYAERI